MKQNRTLLRLFLIFISILFFSACTPNDTTEDTPVDSATETSESSDTTQTRQQFSEKLVFADSSINGFMCYSGEGMDNEIKLTNTEISAIWGNDGLAWLPEELQKDFIWNGNIYFDEKGQITSLMLLGYINEEFSNNGILYCHLEICPDAMPLQSYLFETDKPTCTLFGSPVTALKLGQSVQGYEDTTYRSTEYYIKFMRNAPETIGLYAEFYAPENEDEATLAIINDLAVQTLDPDKIFQLSQLLGKFPKNWQTDPAFTNYIPESVGSYHYTSPMRSATPDSDTLYLNFSEHENGGGNYFSWQIQKNTIAQEVTDIAIPAAYDLRLYEITDPDLNDFGLTGKCPEEYLDSLISPVFPIEDLTLDCIEARVHPKKETYYQLPYIQLSVRYPDHTVIAFSGHESPEKLLEMFQSLPLSGNSPKDRTVTP